MIASARAGEWTVVLTPQKPVPKNWFPELAGLDLLGLASGGGQQAPIFAAAGAKVTVLDNSARQLEQDQIVAQRDGLRIISELGDMRDLSRFPPESFDLVFNPCSVSFIPAVQTMFDEVYRVLRSGGLFMCGFVNPLKFLFDEEKLKGRDLIVRHRLPYADGTHLNPEELDQLRMGGEPLMFSHSLEDLIAGQLRSGFVLRDLFEDRSSDEVLSEFLPTSFATLAEKRTRTE
jgi:SAM-dependent methyltransferase